MADRKMEGLTMAEKIKPCPFCGDKDPEVHEIQRIDGKLYEIWCWQCGARGGVTSGIKAAVKRWNRRTDDGTGRSD